MIRPGRVGGVGITKASGHLVGLSYLGAADSRRVPCERCGVKAVARCLKADGTYRKQSCPARRAAFRAAREAGKA